MKTTILYSALSLAPMVSLFAQESPWEMTGAAGLSYADGNSESVAYSLQFLGSYKKDGNEAYVGVDYFYSEDEGVESTDSLKIFGQYNRDVSEKFYLGVYGAYFRDTVADIDYRVDPSILLGFRAIDKDGMKLVFEAGPGYTLEESGGVKDSYATVRFSERFEYQFSKTTKFWQSFAITPRVEDFSDYLLDMDAGIETRLTSQWSLRTYVKHRIDSTPAARKGRSDTSLILGVSYDFNGLPEPEEGGGRRSLMPGEDEAAPDESGWISTAALGFSLNKGNSDSMGLDLAWNTAFRSDEREFFFDVLQTFRENNGVTSEDSTLAKVQYNHFLTDRIYVGAAIRYLRDDQADLDYRVTPGLVLGYALIKEKATNLSVEAGPAYTFEKQGGVQSDYVSLVVAERFSHAFNVRFKVTQALEYSAELGNSENYTLLASVGLDTKISDRLIWRIAANYAYDNEPAAGREKGDTSLTSMIGVKF